MEQERELKVTFVCWLCVVFCAFLFFDFVLFFSCLPGVLCSSNAQLAWVKSLILGWLRKQAFHIPALKFHPTVGSIRRRA